MKTNTYSFAEMTALSLSKLNQYLFSDKNHEQLSSLTQTELEELRARVDKTLKPHNFYRKNWFYFALVFALSMSTWLTNSGPTETATTKDFVMVFALLTSGFSAVGGVALLAIYSIAASTGNWVAGQLSPISTYYRGCHEALELGEKSEGCKAYQAKVNSVGREFIGADLQAMRAIERHERVLLSQSGDTEACAQLHGIRA